MAMFALTELYLFYHSHNHRPPKNSNQAKLYSLLNVLTFGSSILIDLTQNVSVLKGSIDFGFLLEVKFPQPPTTD